MFNTKKIYCLFAFVALGALSTGCAGNKQISSTQMPGEGSSDQATAKSSLKHADHYVVKRHDTLWAIAGKSSVYGDPFEWPLLFKANRDKIQDPDLIYPKQKFSVVRTVTSAEKAKAEELADQTPKYQPHDKPKEKLAVSYF